jgi:hypothetical protein
VDIEHPLTLVDAVDWAFFNAGKVLQVHTRLRNDVSHGCRSLIHLCVVATASNAILIA